MPDVAVVGAGPAGLAAACAAAELGADVVLLDENPAPGGQIWRQAVGKAPQRAAQRWLNRLERPNVRRVQSAAVVDVPEPGRLFVAGPTGIESIHYTSIVLATGARELLLPFPGWTLPGVMGVGGAQALLKAGGEFVGARVVVSGSGPLLMAVGAAFAAAGAELVGIYEQTSLLRLARFGARAGNPSRWFDAVRYFGAIGAAPFETGTWVAAAHGDDRVEAVTVTNGRTTSREPCDLLAVAFGLVPNVELAELLGCRIQEGSVLVDERQQTSVSCVFAAGEVCGIGGVEVAEHEGTAAGAAAAGGTIPRPRRSTIRADLAACFALRSEVRALAHAQTILCRCEDVRFGEIDPTWSARQAKLFTRIGMGPCQGRVCGAAARCLFGWEPDHVRPPIYPCEVNSVAAAARP